MGNTPKNAVPEGCLTPDLLSDLRISFLDMTEIVHPSVKLLVGKNIQYVGRLGASLIKARETDPYASSSN